MQLIKLFLIIIVTIFLSTDISFSRGSISGIVLDSITKQPIVGVSVSIGNNYKGTIVDFEGKFEIRNLPEKYFSLTFVGYTINKITFDSILVKPYENIEIDTFYLEHNKNPGIEVVEKRDRVIKIGPPITNVKRTRNDLEDRTYIFSGYIFSVEDSLPIHGSVVKIYDTKLGAVPNTEGFFIVKNLKTG